MEGVLAGECYGQAKDEGCKVEVVWQDGDSSSAKGVMEHHTDCKVYKCGGHVGRAHANNLKDASKRKHFSADIIRKYKEKFPMVEFAKCKCARHKAGCGCLSDNFIKGARINHFCCLQQCKDPREYARRMRALSKYHCRDVHEWDGDGECGFHAKKTCTCKSCDEDEEIKCEGAEYKTKHPLTCDFHWLEYQFECERRAADADHVIHPVMGRGNSNQCEAHFTVLPQFRAKDMSLCRLHYITSTNCGLCQGNMTWCYDVRGPTYHWIIDLYDRLNLPVIPAIVTALQKAASDRIEELKKQKTAAAKQNRIHMKVARAEEQEARRKWGKRQTVMHTYGNDDEDDEGDPVDQETVRLAEAAIPEGIDGSTTVISGKKCRCGSTEHRRTSNKACRLNKNNLKQT
ncbi:hypothetical protein QZH41_007954 [Actinostola sp. cb2023]|nr:hypothetical protein QZH41_007954 [Actinostola sp. cb2023]